MVLSVILIHKTSSALQQGLIILISGCGRPFSSTSSTQYLESIGHTLKFIEKCLECLDTNYYNRNSMHYAKTQELFETIPQTLLRKK